MASIDALMVELAKANQLPRNFSTRCKLVVEREHDFLLVVSNTFCHNFLVWDKKKKGWCFKSSEFSGTLEECLFYISKKY